MSEGVYIESVALCCSPDKEGVLFLQSADRGHKWSEKYCILKENYLFCFKSHPSTRSDAVNVQSPLKAGASPKKGLLQRVFGSGKSSAPLVVPLEEARIQEVPDGQTAQEHCFCVFHPGLKSEQGTPAGKVKFAYYFAAHTAQDCEAWVFALSNCQTSKLKAERESVQRQVEELEPVVARLAPVTDAAQRRIRQLEACSAAEEAYLDAMQEEARFLQEAIADFRGLGFVPTPLKNIRTQQEESESDTMSDPERTLDGEPDPLLHLADFLPPVRTPAGSSVGAVQGSVAGLRAQSTPSSHTSAAAEPGRDKAVSFAFPVGGASDPGSPVAWQEQPRAAAHQDLQDQRTRLQHQQHQQHQHQHQQAATSLAQLMPAPPLQATWTLLNPQASPNHHATAVSPNARSSAATSPVAVPTGQQLEGGGFYGPLGGGLPGRMYADVLQAHASVLQAHFFQLVANGLPADDAFRVANSLASGELPAGGAIRTENGNAYVERGQTQAGEGLSSQSALSGAAGHEEAPDRKGPDLGLDEGTIVPAMETPTSKQLHLGNGNGGAYTGTPTADNADGAMANGGSAGIAVSLRAPEGSSAPSTPDTRLNGRFGSPANGESGSPSTGVPAGPSPSARPSDGGGRPGPVGTLPTRPIAGRVGAEVAIEGEACTPATGVGEPHWARQGSHAAAEAARLLYGAGSDRVEDTAPTRLFGGEAGSVPAAARTGSGGALDAGDLETMDGGTWYIREPVDLGNGNVPKAAGPRTGSERVVVHLEHADEECVLGEVHAKPNDLVRDLAMRCIDELGLKWTFSMALNGLVLEGPMMYASLAPFLVLQNILVIKYRHTTLSSH